MGCHRGPSYPGRGAAPLGGVPQRAGTNQGANPLIQIGRADVRFGAENRLKSDIAPGPKSANGLMRRDEDKRPDSGVLRSSEQNWTSIIWERGHTGTMASERKVPTREEFSCTSRAR